MVMEYGMSRLGRINYRGRAAIRVSWLESPRATRTQSQRTDGARDRRRSATHHRRSDRERCGTSLEARRPALEALTRRLIEVESMDADELKEIVERARGAGSCPAHPKRASADRTRRLGQFLGPNRKTRLNRRSFLRAPGRAGTACRGRRYDGKAVLNRLRGRTLLQDRLHNGTP